MAISPGAPTTFTASPANVTTSERITLAWSGATVGTYPIAKYEIQYCNSDDEYSWDGWNKCVNEPMSATYGSTWTYFTDRTRLFELYRIRAVDTYGNTSPYRESNSVMQGKPATPPTVFTASPATYTGGEITLSWSGAAAGRNPIARYEIQYATSTNGTSWGAWNALNSVSSSAYSGSTKTTTVNATKGGYTRYQIRCVDTGGLVTAYKVSNNVKTSEAPAAPVISLPIAGKTTYNPKPRLLITVSSLSNTIVANGYTASGTGNLVANRRVVLQRTANLTGAGAQSVSVTANDALGSASPAVTRAITYARPTFTDATLVQNQTAIRAAHINELRTMVNNVRAYYGLPAKAWAESVTGGYTRLSGWKAHVLEIRTAIDDVVNLVNGWDTASTTHRITLPAWIAIPENKPTVAVMNQLREALTLL